MKNTRAIDLFLKREGKELVGKNRINFWLFFGIFFVAIVAIGFGSASMDYLRYKMDDPFINWIKIVNANGSDKKDVIDLKQYLTNKSVQDHFNFNDVQPGYTLFPSFENSEHRKAIELDGRSINAGSQVLQKVLGGDNVVVKRALPFGDNELGLIITTEMMRKLGYEEPPAFVALSQVIDISECESVGLNDGRLATPDAMVANYPVNLPVIAVVNQLPGNFSFLFSERFEIQMCNPDEFNITLSKNNRSLIICGSDDNLAEIEKHIDKNDFKVVSEPYLESFKKMYCLRIRYLGDSEDAVERYNNLYDEIKNNNVVRVYDMPKPSTGIPSRVDFYSIQMQNLDSIVSFQNDIYDKCGNKLEMTTIDAKNNFRFVQRMGMVLSNAVIFIVALFILVFVSFLLRSHFQKIQKNLGTFKAFGIDNKTLNTIYIRLLLRITVAAFLAAFLLALLIALLLRAITVIELGYPWVSVFQFSNLLLFLLSVVAAVAATLIVSRTMLNNTPGDLIYGRV